MLYYRLESGGRDLSRAAGRAISLVSLVSYPVGASLVGFGDSLETSIAGYALITLALVCVAVMTGSTLQRIVGEQVDRLDEYEIKLRSRAVGAAYVCLSTLLLLAILYSAIASDKGGWVPATYAEFNGIFWGVFLYATMLPSACLAWQIDASDALAQD